ncbi:hypothetical protein ABT336_02350 [Micromonospora sp. NPDC000207]|uniref:hypothetical protein n=1 Tax=Micromonospora sp. NPDC000207 TaxID=3154246 RepID=UPI003334345E
MTGGSVLAVPDKRVIRDKLPQLFVADQLGPLAGPAEKFSARENPLDRSVLGRLAANGEPSDPATEDTFAEATTSDALEGGPDPTAPNVPSLAPSALGFTTSVTPSIPELQVSAAWGSYDIGVDERAEHATGWAWRRHQRSGRPEFTLQTPAPTRRPAAATGSTRTRPGGRSPQPGRTPETSASPTRTRTLRGWVNAAKRTGQRPGRDPDGVEVSAPEVPRPPPAAEQTGLSPPTSTTTHSANSDHLGQDRYLANQSSMGWGRRWNSR